MSRDTLFDDDDEEPLKDSRKVIITNPNTMIQSSSSILGTTYASGDETHGNGKKQYSYTEFQT